MHFLPPSTMAVKSHTSKSFIYFVFNDDKHDTTTSGVVVVDTLIVVVCSWEQQHMANLVHDFVIQ